MAFMLASRPSFSRLIVLTCLLVGFNSAFAGMFDDDEARRAILDLRQSLESVKQSKAETDKRISDETQRASEEAAQLRRSILDLQNQLETARADMAKLRGQNEQLARDVSEFQRRQKDANAGLEERLRKFEPLSVAVDGREFLAEPAEKREYESTLALFRKGDFANAGNGFVDFLNKYPQSGYRPSALFWLGNAQYATKDCKSAMVNFRSLIALAPEHVNVPEARLTIANCLLEAKDPKAAKKTLEELIAAHPNTDAANAAKDRLSRIK
jgi:tol-pal system protein YbgF